MDRSTGQWQNQTIYCGAHELRQLRDALNSVIDDGASDEEASSPSEGEMRLSEEKYC
jgi:hypothetical protein